MIPPHEAAWEVHEFLTRAGLRYAIIGGVAAQHWGEPRLTVDLDVTVAAPLDQAEILVRALVERFSPRHPDPVTFARQTRVVPVRAANGCPVDISLAIPGYEDELMARAVEYELEPGRIVRLASAEDIIIHKAVAGRPQDLKDIAGVVYRRRETLDVSYVRRWLREFSSALDMPEILERFEQPWSRIRS